MKSLWFMSGLTLGLTTLSIAMGSVPTKGQITDDTVLYQRLSEIRVKKQADPVFDRDLELLSKKEPRYRERLPSLAENPRLLGPMARINAQDYRYKPMSKKSSSQSKRPASLKN